MRDNLITALELAARGIAVFPVAVRKLEDGTLEKKPVVRWRNEATALRAQVRSWWAAHPDCVIGIDLDRAGLFVVDQDRHPNAPDGVAAFHALRGDNPVPNVPVTVARPAGCICFSATPQGLPTLAATCLQARTCAVLVDLSWRRVRYG